MNTNARAKNAFFLYERHFHAWLYTLRDIIFNLFNILFIIFRPKASLIHFFALVEFCVV